MMGKKLLCFNILFCLTPFLAWAAPPSNPPAEDEAAVQNSLVTLDRSLYYMADEAKGAGPVSVPSKPVVDCDSSTIRGDLDRDNIPYTYNDMLILVNCTFLNSNGPRCLLCVGDLNCDKTFTASDVVRLGRYIVDPPPAEIRCPD
jgi:hypothetical protein